MTDIPAARSVVTMGTWTGTADQVVLSYEERFLRRKVLTSASGTKFLVDLEKTTSLNQGDAFEMDNGSLVEIRAAREPLLEVTGDHLVRIAWHIGNRHTPCQIEENRLLIQRDHVIAEMLTFIDASIKDVTEPFTPEGGAYGHGRTHGHDHSHAHGPDGTPSHSHPHGDETDHHH